MVSFLAAFHPDRDRLLQRMAPHVDDGMLEDIAAADYGFKTEAHLARLKALRDDLECGPLNWEPREVLELTRWSEPDDPSYKGGGKGARGHWMRAFACAALLRAYGAPENEGHRYGLNETLAPLLMSVAQLDAGLDADVADFLAWSVGYLDAPGEDAGRAFLGVGLLWSALRVGRIDDGVIVALCEWTAAQERMARNDAGVLPERWLLPTTPYGQRHHVWEALGAQICAMDAAARSPAARDWVVLIGASLAGTAQ